MFPDCVKPTQKPGGRNLKKIVNVFLKPGRSEAAGMIIFSFLIDSRNLKTLSVNYEKSKLVIKENVYLDTYRGS